MKVLEPSGELELVVATAILRFLLDACKATDVASLNTICSQAEEADPRLKTAIFSPGSELAKIWELADNYADAVSEPYVYTDVQQDVVGWKTTLVEWAAHVVVRDAPPKS